jgi:hypothetical protein
MLNKVTTRVTWELSSIKGHVYQLKFMKLVREAKLTWESGLVWDKIWFKGVLTSKKLGTLIDSELLTCCLQADYILSHIWVCILKTLCSLEFTPLLLSTVVVTSPLLVMLLCTVDMTTHLLAALLCSAVMTPQSPGMLLWFVYAFLQLIVISCLLHSVAWVSCCQSLVVLTLNSAFPQPSGSPLPQCLCLSRWLVVPLSQ